MSETEHPTIETLFSNLDKWRHFAGYPLEARVDALIGLFLPKVIEDCCGVEVHPQIIPQFPLRKSGDKNRCYWLDYFALSEDGRLGFLIELKTDMGSRSKDQYKYIKEAKKEGMRAIICNLKKVAKARDKLARKKYFHILHALSEIGLIDKLPCDLEGIMYKDRSQGVFCRINKITLSKDKEPELKVIYIQPQPGRDKQEGFRYIYFDELACSVQKHGELGELLACYLKRWKTDPGLCPPTKA